MVYDYKKEETFFVATKLCLKCDDEILTLMEAYPGLPLWRELPGGKISKSDGEVQPLSTLAREVEEELGVIIDFNEENTQLFHVEKRYERVTFQEEKFPFIFLCYLYEIDHKPEYVLTEHSEIRWIKEPDIDTFSDWRLGFDTIVRKAFKFSKK